MNAPKSLRSKGARRAILSSLLAGAAAIGVMTPAESAHASSASPATAFGMMLAEAVVGSAIGYGMGYFYPSQTTTTNLSASSLAAIQSEIDSALEAQSLSDYKGEANALVQDVVYYYRGTTCDDLSTSLSTVQNTILYDANDLMGKLQSCGYPCASLYNQVGTIYVAFEKEQYELVKEQNDLGCASNSPGTISNYLSNYQTASRTVLSNMKKYQAIFDAEWSTSLSWSSNTTKYHAGSCVGGIGDLGDNARHGYANYGITYTPYGGSAQTLFPTSDLSETSDVAGSTNTGYFWAWHCLDEDTTDTSWQYDSDQAARSQGNAQVFLKNMKAYHRDLELGASFYEIEATLQKIANGDFNYCGDGICSVGEAGSATDASGSSVPWCGDCATSDYAVYAYGSGKTLYTTQATTLLSYGGLSLNWQGDGNLVLYSSSGTALWSTGTGGRGNRLVLQTDGNICIYDSSGNCVWASGTPHTNNGTIDPPRAQYLVLMSDGLHVMDDLWRSWWASSTDWHSYADLASEIADGSGSTGTWPSSSPRQCWTKGTAQTLLSSGDYSLVWDASGNLLVAQNGATQWSSGTSASAEYLCNEENGNLSIYDAYANTIWSTSTGSGTSSYNWDGVGADLVLAGKQLRVVAASGEPIWMSNTCSGTGSGTCKYDNEVAVKSFPTSGVYAYGTVSGTQTIVSNEYAELDFLSTGDLVLYDLTPTFYGGGSKVQLWHSGTAGRGVSLWLDADDGNSSIRDSFGGILWIGWGDGVGSFVGLAGCNFFIGNSSTGGGGYSSKTACQYGTSSSTLVSAAN